MQTTEIPPKSPTPPPLTPRPGAKASVRPTLAPRSSGPVDILEQAPPLFLELQDQITRSRLREAFWISVVVHLFAVIALINTPRLMQGRPVTVLNARDLMHDKELTYLELPPDEQTVAKRPDTNVISDKNRIASSKNPTIDRKTLQELRDSSARRGAPGHGAASPPAVSPPSPAMSAQGGKQAQATTAQQQPGQAGLTAPQNTQTQAKLEPPPLASSGGKGAFNIPSSAGSAIQAAARAAAASRAGFGGSGSGGDYGMGIPRQGGVQSNMEILSDTMGVDFGPYLARVVHDVRENWYNLIPEVARPPIMKKGKVSIEFAIMKNGSVQGLRLITPSGDISLDRAAWGGITASNPFPPLPNEFGGQYLALRFHFYYNPERGELR